MPPYAWYLVVLAVAAAATAASAAPAAWLARRVGYVALPSARSVHTRATPYGGGAAMFVGFLVAMMVAAVVPALRSTFARSSEPLGVILAGAAIFAVGLIDDVREMSAPAKVAGQVLAASVLYFLGVTLYWFKVPLAGVIALTPGVVPLITAIWVIAITNAVNLIDGLDGLAAGVVAIGGGALTIYAIRLMQTGVLSPDNIGPLVAAIACGVSLGFLPFNFHPARMFMGDAGALLLGLLMSAATMVIGGRIPPSSPTTGLTYFFFLPVFIPFFILGVPLLDMAFAFIRRTARGGNFHTPDKDHIHHRLLRLGHGHRRSVVILWAWTALLSGFILVPLFVHRLNAFIPLGAGVLGIGLYTFFHPQLRRRSDDEPGNDRTGWVPRVIGGRAAVARPEDPATEVQDPTPEGPARPVSPSGRRPARKVSGDGFADGREGMP